MHYKILGSLQLPDLSDHIKKEALHLFEINKTKPGVVAPSIQSRAHLAYLKNQIGRAHV